MDTTILIAAIELGSSKAIGVMAKKEKDGNTQILSYVEEKSSEFIHKGVIYNLDKTTQCLKSIIGKLEDETNHSIEKVFVCIGGKSIHSVPNFVKQDFEEESIITETIVNSIWDKNTEVTQDDIDVLEVVPQEYIIGNDLQVNPIGVATKHLEGNFINIVARPSVKKNMEYCFKHANMEIAEQMIAPIVTGDAVLTETEKNQGCVLVDFGADTTTVSIYRKNILRFISVIPLGGNSITRDITTLQIDDQEAEELKIKYGDALYKIEKNEMPNEIILKDGINNISPIKLNEIIEARAEEIVKNVWNQIQLSGYEGKLQDGLIMTGGGANLRNLEQLIRKNTNLNRIRLANSICKTILCPNEILKNDCTQNTIFGLVLKGNQNCCQIIEDKENEIKNYEPQKDIFGNQEEESIDNNIEQEKAEVHSTNKPNKKEANKKSNPDNKQQEKPKNSKKPWSNLIDKISKDLFDNDDTFSNSN
ncbi:MAG: cell division protein FtsA [Bacteroidaceae bacterium]|nr:cell division protein FtsA [Bacteroidaceae bacterium]